VLRALGARAVGRALIVVSFIAFVVAMVYLSSAVRTALGMKHPDFPISPGLAPVVVIGALAASYGTAALGVRVHRRGRRYGAPHVPAGDASFVLYLRPFAVDARLAGMSITRGRPTGAIRTFEEQLKDAFATVGAMVTVPRPGEELPEAGAIRIASPAQWQATVGDLLGRAALVVIVVGTSPGLAWEMAEAARRLRPERLLLLFLGRSDEFATARRTFTRRFPRGLPAYPPGPDGLRIPANCAVWFRPDWTPVAVRLDRGKGNPSHLFESALVYGLPRVYQAIGAAWPGFRSAPMRWTKITRRAGRRALRTALLVLVAIVALVIVANVTR
jgi:hypothetical protein